MHYQVIFAKTFTRFSPSFSTLFKTSLQKISRTQMCWITDLIASPIWYISFTDAFQTILTTSSSNSITLFLTTLKIVCPPLNTQKGFHPRIQCRVHGLRVAKIVCRSTIATAVELQTRKWAVLFHFGWKCACWNFAFNWWDFPFILCGYISAPPWNNYWRYQTSGSILGHRWSSAVPQRLPCGFSDHPGQQ